MSTTKASLGTLFLTLSLAAPALAQEPPRQPITDKTKERWAKSQGGRFGFEIDVLSSSYQTEIAEASAGPEEVEVTDSDRLGITITAAAQYKIFAGLHVDAEMPFIYGNVSGPQSTDLFGKRFWSTAEYSDFLLGNPTFGLHYAGNLLPNFALFGGFGVTVPLHPHPSAGLEVAAVANFPARAYFDAQRVLLGHWALRARVGTEIHFGKVLFLTHDVAVQAFVPTREGDFTKSVIEQGNEIEFRPFGNFGFGMRLQAAFPLSSSNSAQLAAEPFLGWEPLVKGSFTRIGALVALDDDLGFGLDRGKVATIRVALGSKW
ncbi:MAG TPA: hypothetical protein VL242_26580 [Sorangium sp.]|uniref:hypothetical protein n=1 Tax=Sorangium sp. So ce1153 TaxID=3133333 RepID=UPI002D062AAF|nr:hypothetical protein [Sorangium sp.]